jgi:uncharacterized repeat protein (TIGR03803 family)
MHSKQHFPNVIFGESLRPQGAALAIMLLLLFLIFVLLFMTLATQPAHAQTFNVIYSFTGGLDGGYPSTGLTMDRKGNLYGTIGIGGAYGYGAVFKLSHQGSGWVFNLVYSFQGGYDGADPEARVVFGPDGSLYGTTQSGGGYDGCSGYGCGTIFKLRPQPRACVSAFCPWTETVLYQFSGGYDGSNPVGDLIFDQAGNLYGAAFSGGIAGWGLVYELTPSNGFWAETVLYSFTGGKDGSLPSGGVIFDQGGNLYGVTHSGINGVGTVYELTPSGSSWAENTLFDFIDSWWSYPVGSLVFDEVGDLYGVTRSNHIDQGFRPGGVYELTKSSGNWILKTSWGYPWWYPDAGLTMDVAGNLYGTATGLHERDNHGTVFKFTRDLKTITFMHGFTGGDDGQDPECSVLLDAGGNLYGTAYRAGAYGYGTVWEIMP